MIKLQGKCTKPKHEQVLVHSEIKVLLDNLPISDNCGMQDLGLNGRRVAICGKGSTSFLGCS